MKQTLLASLCLGVLAASALADIKINEVLCQSVPTDTFGRTGGFRDEDKHLSDFIELANTGAADVSLQGYKLSDEPNNLAKWEFGAGASIPAGGYLVVYASGKNRQGATWHTNFSLDRGGEYLALVGPDGKVLDEFNPLPRQYSDVSYSRQGYHPKLTPGAANEAALLPPAGDVEFSIKTRTFTGTLTLELTSKNLPDGARIGYTVDGKVPDPTLTTAPTWYAGPITLDKTQEIRARVYKDGHLPSETQTEAFVKVLDTVATWNSNLPVIVLDNFGKRRPPANRFVSAEMMTLEPRPTVDGSKRTSILQEAELTTRCAIRTRGSSTNGNAKMNLALETWYDDMDFEDKDVSLFGLPADSDWVLHGPFDFDKALIRNSVAFELGRQLGGWHPRTKLVEVFINIDGDDLEPADYYGVYELMERIKQGEDRVNIQDANGAVNGGYMMKVDRTSVAGQDPSFGAGGDTFVWVEPNAEMVLPAQRTWIVKFINDAAAAMKAANAEDPEQGYRKWIDSRSWIDEWNMRVLTKDPDGFRLSTYLYLPRNGRLHYGPLWDFDRTMGCDSDDRAKLVKGWANIEYFATFGMWKNLMGSGTNTGKKAVRPDFHQEMIDRWQENRRHQLATENMHRVVDGFAAEVREAQARNFARWTGQKPPGNNRDYNAGQLNWEGEIVHLKTWLKLRAEFMDTQAQYIPPPALEKVGVVDRGTTVLVPVSGSQTPEDVYYTTDGTDPRAVGGAPSSTAIRVQGPVVIDKTGQYNFRRNRGEFWSGPIHAGFVVGGVPATKENLLVSEIMYHPAPGTETEQGAGHFHPNSFEYVEFTNVGDKEMFIGDVSVAGGIRFWFQESKTQILPPGGRVVIVSDVEGFTKRYGKDLPIAREFVGHLSDSGERITVMRGGDVLHEIRYEDGGAWPATTDGTGIALTLREAKPGADLSNPANWTTDTAKGGTPGKPGNVPPVVYVNEVLANSGTATSDAIELHNPGKAEVDISGWYLSDDQDRPNKYTFPAGTKIPAGGYLVIRQDNDNDPNNNANLPPEFFGKAFGLSSTGDSVYLYSVANGEMTGFRDGFRFGDSPVGGTFGRTIDGNGDEHHPLLASASLGQANGAPYVGPVVITEVMYNPLAGTGAAEYVEIHNRSASPVPLFDEARPDNTWRLRGADFRFPKGVTLAPGEIAMVVNVSPEEFRKSARLDAAVKIFGPFDGRLDNAGEDIELQRPEAPIQEGNETVIPHVTVDEVNYGDNDPWPSEADGQGPALERKDLAAYGNDASNWRAGASGGSVGRHVKPGEDVEAWKKRHFTAEEQANANLSGLAANFDGDAFGNLLEYAMALDPKAPDASPFRLGVTTEGAKRLTLTVRRRQGAEVSFRLEASTNLQTWSTLNAVPQVVDVAVSDNGPAVETLRYTDLAVIAPGGPRYLRLKVASR